MVWHFVERDMIAQDLYLRSGVHLIHFSFLFLHNAQEIITYFLHPKTGLKKATLAYDTSEKSRDILWLEKKDGKLA